MKRRTMLKSLAAGAAAAAAGTAAATTALASSGVSLRFLRPPGALAERDFVSTCIRCGQCGQACPNSCIEFFGLENGLASMGTPYITPRQKACILCMKCGQVCPTGALKEIVREAAAILDEVHMGKARVNKKLCLSYQGKSCGVCYRACPLQDISIQVGFMEQPTVLARCVGCGLCERACIQMPQAIRIMPDHQA